MPELSLFRFSAIFITEPLTKTLLAIGRPPAGLPAAGSAQGREAQGRAKAPTVTGQDGHFHVAVGHQTPRHPGIPRQGSRKDPRAEPEDKTLVDSLGHRWGTRPCGQTAGPTCLRWRIFAGGARYPRSLPLPGTVVRPELLSAHRPFLLPASPREWRIGAGRRGAGLGSGARGPRV
ncbi:unnamed protein product [Rangifer tarandus platyrhynchus]|uniref:Uncharacterized protein n=1 Tax=Rangifer tarandus platyrhynchus TaxID=3082113 RepID=A0AC59ZTL5_RANTA